MRNRKLKFILPQKDKTNSKQSFKGRYTSNQKPSSVAKVVIYQLITYHVVTRYQGPYDMFVGYNYHDKCISIFENLSELCF